MNHIFSRISSHFLAVNGSTLRDKRILVRDTFIIVLHVLVGLFPMLDCKFDIPGGKRNFDTCDYGVSFEPNKIIDTDIKEKYT